MRHRQGFTIVELLIVVVVIAILAAITIVAYNGIQNRSRSSALASSASQAAKKVLSYAAVNNDLYPTQAMFTTETGLSNSSTTSYDYFVTSDQKNFCVSAADSAKADLTHAQTNKSGAPAQGRCVQNMEPNPSSESTVFASAGAGANSRVLSSAQKYSGTNSTLFTWGSAASGMQSSTHTVTPSTTYFVSIYIYSVSGVLPVFWVAASDYGTNVVTLSGAAAVGSWQRLYSTYTTNSTQTTLRIWTTVGAASSFYADAIMISPLSKGIPEYGDGASTNWVWTGTANNSTSFGASAITQ